MATTICLQTNHANKVTIHSLPCKIKHSGKAKVSDYFVETEPEAKIPNGAGINGSIVDGKLQQKKYSYDQTHCYFRGRALLKNTIKLDDGICGYRLHTIADNSEKKWQTKGTFEEINVWSLAHKQRNKYENSINNWYKISAAIHAPINHVAEKQCMKSSPNAMETD